VDARGEILELKETINTMVDQLSLFADEVTRVAREVGTEGNLGGQAVVRGVSGTWKDLTDNVNVMASNLTAQVRSIAQVATAVARAAVGRPINGVMEIAGPEAMGMDDFVRTGLAANGDQRRVVTDVQAPYFGAVIDDHTLAPDENATIFTTRYSDWIDAYSSRRI